MNQHKSNFPWRPVLFIAAFIGALMAIEVASGDTRITNLFGNWTGTLNASRIMENGSWLDAKYQYRDTWTTHDDYPASCGSGDFVQAVGDTLTCTQDRTNSTAQIAAVLNINGIVGNPAWITNLSTAHLMQKHNHSCTNITNGVDVNYCIDATNTTAEVWRVADNGTFAKNNTNINVSRWQNLAWPNSAWGRGNTSGEITAVINNSYTLNETQVNAYKFCVNDGCTMFINGTGIYLNATRYITFNSTHIIIRNLA